MATQVIVALIIVVVSYVGTGVLLLGIVTWVMRRLDDPAASATEQCRAMQCQLASTLSIQADLGRRYPPEGCMRKTIEADQFGYSGSSGTSLHLSEQPQELLPHVGLEVDGELSPVYSHPACG